MHHIYIYIIIISEYFTMLYKHILKYIDVNIFTLYNIYFFYFVFYMITDETVIKSIEKLLNTCAIYIYI